MDLTPTKPYLIRAFYEWIMDNDLTPHLMVDAEAEGVQVPAEFVADGQNCAEYFFQCCPKPWIWVMSGSSLMPGSVGFRRTYMFQ